MERVIAACLSSVVLLVGTMGMSQAATPLATGSPVASPEAGPVVTDYGEVGPAYEAAREELLPQGREVVELLRAGDVAAVLDRLSPEVTALVTEDDLRTLIPDLETDRVHFELPQVGGIFDGHLEGGTIEGFYQQVGVTSFRLEAVGAAATPVADQPLAGRWEGAIGAGEMELGIVVEFEVARGDLHGTIDIPEQGATDLPLANLSYQETVEIGGRVNELALPAAPTYQLYAGQYAWGDASLALSMNVGEQGAVSGLQVTPHWPLPPDPAAGMETTTTFRLPFEGVWWVLWGGETVLENYHAAVSSQRHAYDLMIWKDGATYMGDGAENEDYWAWGQPVLAPAEGTVVAVRDNILDNTPGQLSPEPHPAGNHVVIQTAEEEFVFIAHLQQGSVRVAEGDQVRAGDVLGLTGNSGNSSEPHVHIHAQNRADFFAFDAIGLPLRFSDILINGEPVDEGAPTRGQFVAQQ